MRNTDHVGLPRCFALGFIAVLLAGCVPLTPKDLRTSSLAGHIAFEVNTPQSVLHKTIFDTSTRCLYEENGVVTHLENNTASSNITFSFTEAGFYLTTVTIDMTSVTDAETSVVIYYVKSTNGRWWRYSEKVKEWALQQTQDCRF